MNKIELFQSKKSLSIKPCSPRRDWMDADSTKHPYKCNPMTVANSYGWEVYSPSTFSVIWDGTTGNENSIMFRSKEKNSILPDYYFGNGILTWETGFIFKTEYPYGMFVTAPTNTIIKNVTPLSGVVETYWLPFTFTINWKINQPGVPININKGDVLAQIFPIIVNVFDDVDLQIKNIEDAPGDFKTNLRNWTLDRNKNSTQYQGHYHRGEIPGCPHFKEPNRYSRIRAPWPEEETS